MKSDNQLLLEAIASGLLALAMIAWMWSGWYPHQ